MATDNPILDISVPAAEDLSNDQYRFVVLASTGVRRPDAATEVPYGILQNAPAVAGQAATVRIAGISKLQTNYAAALGDFVGPEYVGAADAGKGAACGPNWDSCRGLVVEAAAAEDDLASVLLIGPFAPVVNSGIKKTTVSTITDADVATYTAAQLLGGLILRDCAGASRSDVTPTAALLIAAMKNAGAGDSIEFTIRNTSDAAETITVTAGTDVTLSGTMTIAQNNSKRFLAVVTSATEVTIYSLGTVVH